MPNKTSMPPRDPKTGRFMKVKKTTRRRHNVSMAGGQGGRKKHMDRCSHNDDCAGNLVCRPHKKGNNIPKCLQRVHHLISHQLTGQQPVVAGQQAPASQQAQAAQGQGAAAQGQGAAAQAARRQAQQAARRAAQAAAQETTAQQVRAARTAARAAAVTATATDMTSKLLGHGVENVTALRAAKRTTAQQAQAARAAAVTATATDMTSKLLGHGVENVTAQQAQAARAARAAAQQAQAARAAAVTATATRVGQQSARNRPTSNLHLITGNSPAANAQGETKSDLLEAEAKQDDPNDTDNLIKPGGLNSAPCTDDKHCNKGLRCVRNKCSGPPSSGHNYVRPIPPSGPPGQGVSRLASGKWSRGSPGGQPPRRPDDVQQQLQQLQPKSAADKLSTYIKSKVNKMIEAMNQWIIYYPTDDSNSIYPLYELYQKAINKHGKGDETEIKAQLDRVRSDPHAVSKGTQHTDLEKAFAEVKKARENLENEYFTILNVLANDTNCNELISEYIETNKKTKFTDLLNLLNSIHRGDIRLGSDLEKYRNLLTEIGKGNVLELAKKMSKSRFKFKTKKSAYDTKKTDCKSRISAKKQEHAEHLAEIKRSQQQEITHMRQECNDALNNLHREAETEFSMYTDTDIRSYIEGKVADFRGKLGAKNDTQIRNEILQALKTANLVEGNQLADDEAMTFNHKIERFNHTDLTQQAQQTAGGKGRRSNVSKGRSTRKVKSASSKRGPGRPKGSKNKPRRKTK